jgi:hypothetical protein
MYKVKIILDETLIWEGGVHSFNETLEEEIFIDSKVKNELLHF